MRVRLKLFAAYRRHLPASSQDGSCDVDVPVGTPVADLLAQFGVPTDDGDSVILVNGHSVEPEQVLEKGVVVAVFPALAGG